ncbi:MAG: hypothetical protein GY810_07220 [Aureispira sp.]|nr:hypothetical protein [Aureispira sp.]
MQILDDQNLFYNTDYPRAKFWLGTFFYIILGFIVPLFFFILASLLDMYIVMLPSLLWSFFCLFKMTPYLFDAIQGDHIVQTSVITKKTSSDGSYYIYTEDKINSPLNFLPVKEGLYEDAKLGDNLAVLKTKYTNHILDQNLLP